ncbi:hypothetical protein HY490_00095 [Candidatus Woesearchaeota archaeon]|nr:hypothetical protein [Candidatus Woesearchaeota archaeon]
MKKLIVAFGFHVLFAALLVLGIFLSVNIFYAGAWRLVENPVLKALAPAPETIFERMSEVSSLEPDITRTYLLFALAAVVLFASMTVAFVSYARMVHVLSASREGWVKALKTSAIFVSCVLAPFFASFFVGKVWLPAVVFVLSVIVSFFATPLVFMHVALRVSWQRVVRAWVKQIPVLALAGFGMLVVAVSLAQLAKSVFVALVPAMLVLVVSLYCHVRVIECAAR